MNKLLVVCGPTATGKTKLALSLAKVFDGQLISVDSRQVYKGLDIGTGKDKPKGVTVLGYDLVSPREEFSVSDYIAYATKVIEEVQQKGKLPILVGGTGFYIKGLIDGIETSSVAKNDDLRKSLERFPPDELYEKLAQLDSTKAASMNTSDRQNPRRLARAIEIAQHNIDTKPASVIRSHDAKNVLFVGLNANKDLLDKMIKERVDKRVEEGIEKEIRGLLDKGISWSDQSMSSLGYRQWKDYFEGGKTKEETIRDWKKEEIKYAKRQYVWFKKDRRINWFDISKPRWENSVAKLVKKWYSSK